MVAGCRSDGSGPTATAGSFSASWVGSDTGKITASPRAVFCVDENQLELLATRADVGVGLVIYPKRSRVEGDFEGFDPAADTLVRPGVTAAARWFTEREIRAFRSDGGSLKLTRKGDAWSGAFAMHLRRVGADTDTIVITGRFSGVVPAPCVADTVSPPDTAE